MKPATEQPASQVRLTGYQGMWQLARPCFSR
jgi:hypothetical protein